MCGFAEKLGVANTLGFLAIALAVAGCDGGMVSASMPEQSGGPARSGLREQRAAGIPDREHEGEFPVLRTQVDAVRGRLWSLSADGVGLYDATTKRKLAHIALPGWLLAGEQYNCPPDLVLGPLGEAIVSSNVVSTLWRIDPVTLAAGAYEPVLNEDQGRDVGFTGLVYSPRHGAYYALSTLHGSLWRIDTFLRRAQKIGLSEPIPRACALALRPAAPGRRAAASVGLCVRSGQAQWAVNLSLDQRSGLVRSERCGV